MGVKLNCPAIANSAMKIATFNVNGVNGRLPRLLEWLAESRPDIACLQETRTGDASFPVDAIASAGYGAIWHGQPRHHGVAILARGEVPLQVRRGLPGDEGDAQARYLEARAKGITVASIYLPNGNPASTPKYDYKIKWMRRLFDYSRERLKLEEPLVLAGDYNVIPAEADVHNPELWRSDALFLPETRARWRTLTHLGLTDAIRATTDDPGVYTFWDYQAGAWQKNNGIRIDHLLLSPQAADRLVTAGIDKHVRAWERPSDHVPVWIELDLEQSGA